jgi:hypothetical protein
MYMINCDLQDFERWITSKEKALEAEAERRKAAEYQLELVTIKKMDVVKISKSQGVMLKQTKEELVRTDQTTFQAHTVNIEIVPYYYGF